MTQKPNAETIQTLPQTGYIRTSQLIPHILPIARSTLWKKIKAGEFPAPVKLGPAITAFRAEAVRAWMDSREVSKPGLRRGRKIAKAV